MTRCETMDATKRFSTSNTSKWMSNDSFFCEHYHNTRHNHCDDLLGNQTETETEMQSIKKRGGRQSFPRLAALLTAVENKFAALFQGRQRKV